MDKWLGIVTAAFIIGVMSEIVKGIFKVEIKGPFIGWFILTFLNLWLGMTVHKLLTHD